MAEDLIGDFVARYNLSTSAERDLRRLFGFSPVRPDGATIDTLPVRDLSPRLEAITEAPRSASERYDRVLELGTGSTGLVQRVYDRHLRRDVAMKTLSTTDPNAGHRFFAEARVGAHLQHPNLLPIYDMGIHDDGQPWFTMREGRGTTMTEAIADVHAASAMSWGVGELGFTLRRLVAGFSALCRAMAYAHSQRVLHRDLKPDNVMVSVTGELVVLDWGLAVFLSDDAPPLGLAGTPAYMAPELADGRPHRDVRGDIYSLGAILYTILMGRPPYSGSTAQRVLGRVVMGPPEPLTTSAHAMPPPELVVACETAMARAEDQRFSSAAALADAVDSWLDDTFKREQALRLTRQALDDVDVARALQEQAIEREQEGTERLESVEPWQPEAAKFAGWALIDEARETAARAQASERDIDQRLFAALRMAPDLPQAHAALLHRFHQRHRQAEARSDGAEATVHEAAMRHHMLALPSQDPRRLASAAYLRGDGTLSLTTSPPGAQVTLYRYTKKHRRLVETFERELGTTPLVDEPLAMGSYLCLLSHPDCEDVRYPVHIRRQQAWSTTAPGDTAPTPVVMPSRYAVRPDEVFVPAGWFESGGDDDTFGSHEARRLWCDDLVVQRFQVTNQDYIVFLDDLVLQGRDADALSHVPRERSSSEGVLGEVLFGRTDEGRFILKADADGDIWEPDWPVMQLDWHSARAYLVWLAKKTGKPWRLPGELEWEKAARGVDGRFFPWGDAFDPSWCCMHDSHRGRQLPVSVDSYMTDVSVYGVRGVAGGVRDWCADYEGAVDNGRVCVPEDEFVVQGNRRVRGGSWYGPARNCRLANRDRNLTGFRVPLNGFRGVYRP